MVFYRKYRPQTIDELDSEKVRETLSAVLRAKDIPHAFLFTGPKGLGKTSTARIIAKVVNCTNRKDGAYNPCNVCDSCIAITKGTSIDVLEIDGASNRGIDEIRDLREKVRLAPATSQKKIYIIDEVHMLTTEAFNALLKTIEEPPSHVMFLFCTTEPQKVPATILSRCFHVSFNRATDEEIKHSLQRIAISENLVIADEALLIIANLADGGFRDAAKILEEIALLADRKSITKELIEQKYHVTQSEQSSTYMIEFLAKKDTQSALQLVQTLVSQGVDMKYFLGKLLNELHKMLLLTVGVQMQQTNAPQMGLRVEEISELVSLLSKAYQDMKLAVIPQLPLEIAIIKYTFLQQMVLVKETVPFVETDGKPTVQSLTRKQEELKVKSILNPVKEEPKKAPENPHEQRVLPAKPDNNGSILENLIYKTKPFNHSVAAVLRGCRILSLTENEIIIEAAYKFHKERLDETKTRGVLEQVLKEITGKALRIKVELKK
ncbi:MAG TPA: DNA polymerase III subunit gamma/tau [Candidatus Saccharimonadales bacterium]|nr:DNA polymerase III subunit gamma/tau [Candidatus Saccharimonadales bacterium]